jgi:archaetidylinositol phosphate synthase
MHPDTESKITSEDRGIEKSTASLLEKWFDRFVAVRLAPIVPMGIKPNQITVLGFSCGLFSALSLYLTSFHKGWAIAAVIALVLSTIADSLDGAVARQRSLTSERGFFLDHLLDQMTFIALFIGVGLSNYAIFQFAAMGAIVANLHLIVELYWIYLRKKFPLPMFGPVEVRFTTMALAVLTFFWYGSTLNIGGFELGWFDMGFAIAAPLSFIEFCISAIALYRELEST